MSEPIISSTVKTAQPGLMSGLAGIGKNLLGLLFNRVELAVFELAQARTQLFKLVLVGAVSLMALFFALAYWTVLIVMVNWDTLGWRILLIMAGVFTLIALALVLYAKSMLSAGKLAMPETLSELRKDRDALLAAGDH